MSFAISSHLDRLLHQAVTPQGAAAEPTASAAPRRETSAIDTSGSHRATASLGAMLGRLGVERQDASSTTEASPAIKPNLDALNRVLNHYTAQSAGVDTIISLVR